MEEGKDHGLPLEMIFVGYLFSRKLRRKCSEREIEIVLKMKTMCQLKEKGNDMGRERGTWGFVFQTGKLIFLIFNQWQKWEGPSSINGAYLLQLR